MSITKYSRKKKTSEKSEQKPEPEKESQQQSEPEKGSQQQTQAEKGSQQKPQAEKGSQQQPQAEKGSQQQPQAEKESQQQPQTGKGSQQQPQTGKGSQQQPQTGKGSQQQPQTGKGSQQQPQTGKGSQQQPQAEKGSQQQSEPEKESQQQPQAEKGSQQQINLSKNISTNIELVKKILGYSSDIIVREFSINPDAEIKAAVILIAGMVERTLINEQVIGALMLNERFNNVKSNTELFRNIKEYGIPDIYIKEESDFKNIINELITGNTIFFLNGMDRVLIIGSQGWKERAVSEPVTENVVRGPRDGFIENIESNTALIRRRVKSPDLRVESLKIGTETKTTISIIYIKGIAKDEIVDEVKKRLNRIEINGILESGYIEEFIEDTPSSPFPQIEHSERPDKVSASILEGRVAILVDTTPFALIVPTIFFQFMQSADDYYERYLIGSLTRAIRILSYAISVIAPALYIALTSFHQEMIPTPLALSIASSREGVPFPSIGEAFMMEAAFEVLREAGLRLPKQAGQAVSIVGGLVIGQAAVQAGIISQAMVIIVSITGISSYAIPAFNAAAAGRLLRFPLMIIASILGLPGILAGLSIIIIHMNSLRSFGVNYMDPFISSNKKEFKDIVTRTPWWRMTRLPGYIANKSSARVAHNIKPEPKKDSGSNTSSNNGNN